MTRAGRVGAWAWLIPVVAGVACFVAARFGPWRGAPPSLAPPNTDAFMYHLPMRAYAFEELAVGRLPVWNPYLMGGQPFLATHQHAALYPGNFPHWFLPPARALGVVMALHILWAALGMYVWLGCWRLPGAARAIGALTFALATSVVNPLQWPHVLLGNAWLPWILAGVDAVATRPTPRRAALLGLAGASLLLAGYIQGAVYIYYAALPYAVFRWWQDRDARAGARAVWLAVGLFAFPLATAAIQLLPMVELSRQSARPPGGLDPQAVQSLGHVPGHMIVRALTGRTVAGENVLALYVPPLAWTLAATAFLLGPGRGRLVFWGGIGVVAALLATGFDTPLYRLYYALPTGDVFRLPVRMLVLTACAVAALAGVGAARLYESGDAGFALKRVLPLLAVCAGIATFVATHQASLAAATVICFVGWCLFPPARTVAALGCVAVVVWGAVRTYRYDVFLPWQGPSPFPTHEPVAAFLRERLGHDRVHIFRTQPDWKNWAYPANWGLNTRIRQLTAYESLPLEGVAGAFNHLMYDGPSASPIPFVGGLELTPDTAHPEWLHLWSVRWIIVDRGVPRWPTRQPPQDSEWLRHALDLERVDVGGEELLYNPHALPRAYWVPAARIPPPGEDVWRMLADPAFDPTREVLLDHRPIPRPSDSPVENATVAFTADTPGRIALDVAAPSDGWVVLTDSWFPGWTVSVDDEAGTLRVANGVFRAVHVAAGRHRVTFAYRPVMLRAGAALTAIGLAAALIGLARPARRGGESSEQSNAVTAAPR